MQFQINMDFREIEADCWRRIEKGATSYRDFFHLPTVGTINQNIPSIRTVVLRAADAEQKTINFHTDLRGEKVRQLRENPAISFLFYHPEDRIQIRMSGIASVEHDTAVADQAWLNSKLSSRKCYLAEKPSGSITYIPEDSIPLIYEGKDPSTEESEVGRKNFCVISSKIHALEWLWLHHKGHRRAKIVYYENGFTGHWLIP